MQLCTYLPRSISRCSFFYGPAPSSLSRLGITTTPPSTQEGLVSDWESYNGQHLPRGMKLIMPSSVHYRAKQSSSTGWEIDRGHCHCPRLGMASLWLSVRYQELRTSVYRTSEGRRWYLWKHSLTSWRKARMGKKEIWEPRGEARFRRRADLDVNDALKFRLELLTRLRPSSPMGSVC